MKWFTCWVAEASLRACYHPSHLTRRVIIEVVTTKDFIEKRESAIEAIRLARSGLEK